MVDEIIFEQNPRNFIPVQDSEIEEYICNNKKVIQNIRMNIRSEEEYRYSEKIRRYETI